MRSKGHSPENCPGLTGKCLSMPCDYFLRAAFIFLPHAFAAAEPATNFAPFLLLLPLEVFRFFAFDPLAERFARVAVADFFFRRVDEREPFRVPPSTALKRDWIAGVCCPQPC